MAERAIDGNPIDAHILVVDDEGVMLSLTTMFLRRCGYKSITSCADVASAREHIKTEGFDLVISDVQMLPEDGISLLWSIRQDESQSRTGVILMTASVGQRIRREAERAGVDAYLIKPFDLPTLCDTVERVLAGSTA